MTQNDTNDEADLPRLGDWRNFDELRRIQEKQIPNAVQMASRSASGRERFADSSWIRTVEDLAKIPVISRQIADLAAVSDACDRWNMPLMPMIYPRGPKIADSYEPDLVAHAVSLAVDLGADMVKTVLPSPVSALTDIAATSPIPIVVAGGAPVDRPEHVVSRVRASLEHGADGAAVGRNVFQAEDPLEMARMLSLAIHRQHDTPDLSRSNQALELT